MEVQGESAVLLPFGPGDSNNFVVGLGVDLTCQEPVHHPNPEKPDLEGAPLLAVATSDQVLRFYRFASTYKPLEGVLGPALPLIQRLPVLQAAAAQGEPEKPFPQQWVWAAGARMQTRF